MVKLDMDKIFYLKAGFITTIMICFILVLATINFNNDKQIDDEPNVEWVLIQEVSLDALGENNPGAEGWLSTFVLDYGQVPETVLANNATDWSASGDAHGYVDTDNTETDLKSEDPGYFVVRCIFDNDTLDGGSFNYSRVRVNLTVSGDETISDVGEYDNSSSDGDAVISAAHANHLYVNFWWDDGVDGYRITDDGTLTWSISIYEKK